jgi:sulfate transport system ATP-binding protein
VRPSDLAVTRLDPSSAPAASGLPAVLTRALVIGPVARLELRAFEQATGAHPQNQAPERILEADLPAAEFSALGVHEGDTVLVSPRKARVFLETPDDPALMI